MRIEFEGFMVDDRKPYGVKRIVGAAVNSYLKSDLPGLNFSPKGVSYDADGVKLDLSIWAERVGERVRVHGTATMVGLPGLTELKVDEALTEAGMRTRLFSDVSVSVRDSYESVAVEEPVPIGPEVPWEYYDW